MDARQLVTRLKDDSAGGPLDRLAALTLEHLLDQPMGVLLPPAFLARGLKAALEGWVSSPSAEAELAGAVRHVRQRLAEDDRSLGEALPPELAKGLIHGSARRHYYPDRELVLAVIDRPPVRALLRAMLLDVLVQFGRKVSTSVTENRVAKGLSGLARKAADQARSSGTFGGFASGVVGAFSEEMERQMERRAGEFADSALSGIIQKIADGVSNPSRSSEQNELRVALMEGVLELTLPQLAQELGRADVPASVASARKSLAHWLASPRAASQLEEGLTRLLQRDASRPARELLGALGLLEAVRSLGREGLRLRMAPLVASEPFALWLEELMREP